MPSFFNYHSACDVVNLFICLLTAMSATKNILDYILVPPCLHRDIAILGMLHKRVFGLSKPIWPELLSFHFDRFGSYWRPNIIGIYVVSLRGVCL